MKTATTAPALTPAASAGLSSTLRSLLNHTMLHPPPDISTKEFHQPHNSQTHTQPLP